MEIIEIEDPEIFKKFIKYRDGVRDTNDGFLKMLLMLWEEL